MSFTTEKAIKATRKRHLCAGCDKWIEVGEPAINWAGVTDGQFDSLHYHPDCRDAEIALNKNYDLNWDEWVNLCEYDAEDKPYLKANWPVPYLRLCMTREQYAAHLAKEQAA